MTGISNPQTPQSPTNVNQNSVEENYLENHNELELELELDSQLDIDKVSKFLES